jgi:hypothetical protein
MTLHTAIKARDRQVNSNKKDCPQCGAFLIAPDWSEYEERSARHAWSCDACGCEFETVVVFPAAQQAA